MLTLSKPPQRDVRIAAFMTEPGWPPQSSELLEKVDRFLRAGRPREGVDAIGDAYLRCGWTANALAVCYLRLGNIARALHILRYITTDHTSLKLRADVPTVFKTNLATAVLAGGDFKGFLSTLDKLQGEDHPSVRRLQTVVDRWKDSLSAWQAFWWNAVGLAFRLPSLDLPLGELRDRPVGIHNSTVHPRDGMLSFGVGTAIGEPVAAGSAVTSSSRAGTVRNRRLSAL